MGAEPSPVAPGFPQLEVANDPERMREVLQHYLRPLDGNAVEIRACRVSYARIRGGARCMLEYTLRLGEPATGREWDQVVTGVIYAGGRTGRTWARLARAAPPRVLPGAFPPLAPFAYVPDLDLLLQVFPHDHRLPALALLMAGPPPELEAKLRPAFGPGDRRVEGWSAESVRYRVDKRATVRLTARVREGATGEVAERRFYAKVYREEEEGAHAYQVLRDLRDQTGGGEAGFRIARPVTYVNGLRTLVQEEAPGTSLDDILLRGEGAIPAMRRAARALAALHLGNMVPARRRPLRDELARLSQARELLRAAHPHLASEIEGVVGAVVAGLAEVAPRPTHCDFRPLHVLLDGDRVVLLDFDKFAGADPLLDVANLLANSSMAQLRTGVREGRSEAAARAFAEEYFAHAPAAWRARLPAHYAMAIIGKAAASHRRDLPGLDDGIGAILQEAKDSLAGRVW